MSDFPPYRTLLGPVEYLTLRCMMLYPKRRDSVVIAARIGEEYAQGVSVSLTFLAKKGLVRETGREGPPLNLRTFQLTPFGRHVLQQQRPLFLCAE